MIQTDVEQRHVSPVIQEEIAVFGQRADRLRKGEITEEEFRPFRLKHGIYGQRQPGVQMVRVKVPSGILGVQQLRELADIADAFSTCRAHVTTRQNMQYHFVKLENVPAIMRRLADVGLTTREAGGNAVRNVTCCPLAGICPAETFDVTPYALHVSRLLLRCPEFQNLPRKFKIAFSGCEDDGDCTLAGINDVGVIARIGSGDATARRGFKVFVGGGLGSLPTPAATLAEFMPEEDLVPTIEAVLRVFNEHGNRPNKYKARLKYVLREKGIETFRCLVNDRRKAAVPSAPQYAASSAVAEPPVTISPSSVKNPTDGPEFARWAQHNVVQQRQPGYAAVWLKLPAGTIRSDQLRGLAGLLEESQLPGLRLAMLQNLVIHWIPVDRVKTVYRQLHALGLASPGARTICDVTSCPGATTCSLGITRALSLAEVLSNELSSETDPETLKLRIKISGCPNACGHHHVADIGLYGNARKLGGRQAPFYQLLLGGKTGADGIRFASQIMPVPAKRIPQVIRELLQFFLVGRQRGESFHDWVTRIRREEIRARLRAFAEPAEMDEDLFVDWGDTETYSLKLGRGECAA